jgi:hypothetical protein
VPGVAEAKVSATVSTEFSMDYTYTETSSSTSSYLFGVPRGGTCFPHEVSWESTCQQSIDIISFKWFASDGSIMYPDQLNGVNNICEKWQSPKSSPPHGQPANNFQWMIFGNNDASGNFHDTFSDKPGFDMITSICSGYMPSPDSNLQVNKGGRKYAAVGCTWA